MREAASNDLMEQELTLQLRALRSPLFGPIDLEIAAGECVSLRGASGSGKSLLLRAIADLDEAEGRVTLDGVSRASMPAWQWRRSVALVPAQSGWWADRVDAHFPPELRPALPALLAELGLPDQAIDWTVDRLSTGEAHRLAIARAVLGEPRVLMLDEPGASLDEAANARVEGLIERLTAQGRMVLVVTHDGAQAVRIARRRYRLFDGGLEHDTSAEGFGDAPAEESVK